MATPFPYLVLELDLERPLPAFALPAEYSGIGVVVRRGESPLGFFMEPLPPHYLLTPEYFAARIIQKFRNQILRDRIFQQLRGPLDETDFPTLDIAICTRGRPESLERCLQSILRIDGLHAAAGTRILVVDNSPVDDRTARVAEKFQEIVYLVEPVPGLDCARNLALKKGQGVLTAFFDDDTVADRSWLKGLRHAWAGNRDAGAFTGPVLPMELTTKAQILFEEMGGFSDRNFERTRYGSALPGHTTYPCGAGVFGTGCNMVVRRQLVLDLGGFDEALDTGSPLPGGGDQDIFYRIVRAGWPLVREPQMLVYHGHRREYQQLRLQIWSWGLTTMAFVAKAYRQNPSERAKFRRLVAWWFASRLYKLPRPFFRSKQRHWPSDIAAAE